MGEGFDGWRCTCMVFVVPGEEHRCFYRDILAVLDRIAVQLEGPKSKPDAMCGELYTTVTGFKWICTLPGGHDPGVGHSSPVPR